MPRNTFIKYICLIIIIPGIACSKSDTMPTGVTPPVVIPPVKTCDIVSAIATSETGTVLFKDSFFYNSDDKLSGSTYASTDSYSVNYTYNGNLIYRAVNAGANSSADTLTLNAAGLLLKRKEVISASTWISNYAYDADNQLVSFSQQQDAYPPVATYYTFANGDNTFSTDGISSNDTLVYDNSKLAVAGNTDQFFQMLYSGAMYIKNKHLLKSESHGNTVNYQYTFNSDGNIATLKMVFPGAGSETITYGYNCH